MDVMNDAERSTLKRQLARDKAHGSPSRRLRDAKHILERLLRATALIPERERSAMILATERKARRMIADLGPFIDQLHNEYFPPRKR